ncbi:MAG: inorganic phosphate transporter, PiT family, partial [Streptomycetaceae bacterium]|nr:inorganic phosphate transporter, PiT family [Streptomycetaceae bacterium]
MDTFGLVVVIGVALFFTYTNGFHDSANAIATSVSTRALTPRAALAMAAVMNLAGAFFGNGVASTVGKDIITTPSGKQGLIVLFAALVGAIAWNLATWYFGLPSSSTHALFGGMVGAALAGASTVHWRGVLDKVVIPMIVSPIIGLVASGVFTYVVGAFTGAFPLLVLTLATTGRRWRDLVLPV